LSVQHLNCGPSLESHAGLRCGVRSGLSGWSRVSPDRTPVRARATTTAAGTRSRRDTAAPPSWASTASPRHGGR